MTTTSKQVKCPSCGGPSLYASANRYRPFCSERCKQIDLGCWAAESYRIPVQPDQNEPGFDSEPGSTL